MAEHNVLTDPELHEPKGVAAAASNQVYVADGATSGTHKQITPANTVMIHSASDFPTAVAGVRTLAAATTYMVSGSVSIGSDRLVMGAATLLKGSNPFADIIVSTTSGTLITSADTFLMDNLGFTCSSGAWLDLNGTGTQTFVATKCVLNSCDAIGTITDMMTTIFDTCQVSAATSGGLTLTGSNHGSFKITNGKFIVTLGPIIDFGTAVFDRIFVIEAVFENPVGVTGLDIAASSANLTVATGIGYIIDNFFLTPANASVGYAVGDVGWIVKGNPGISNNSGAAQGSIVDSALNTSFSGTGSGNDVPVNFGSAWVADISDKFTQTTAGIFTYTGTIPIKVMVSGTMFASIAAGPQTYNYYIAKGGTIIASSVSQQVYDGTDLGANGVKSIVSVVTGSTISLRVRAETATTDLNVDTASITIHEI